eukprot:scaffold6.g2774.t1
MLAAAKGKKEGKKQAQLTPAARAADNPLITFRRKKARLSEEAQERRPELMPAAPRRGDGGWLQISDDEDDAFRPQGPPSPFVKRPPSAPHQQLLRPPSLLRRDPRGGAGAGSLRWPFGSADSSLPAGMLNLGNTCYLNAVLQALFSLPSFVADLQQLPAQLAQEQTRRAQHAGAALHEAQQQQGLPQQQQAPALPGLPPGSVCAGLLECLSAKDGLAAGGPGTGGAPVGRHYIVPAQLKAAIDKRSAAFVGAFQQDAHEFLCCLLQGIQEEVLACEAAALGRRQVRISETADPVARNLGLALQHELTCGACGHASRVVEQYSHLSLELPEGDLQDPASVPPSLDSLLRRYFQDEEVDKACESCGAACVRHALRHRVRRLPRVLALHLKRFRVVPGPGGAPACQKLHTRVGIGENVRLGAFLAQGVAPPLPAPPAAAGWQAGKENLVGAANVQQQQQQQGVAAAAEQPEGRAAAAPRTGPPARSGLDFYSGGGGGRAVGPAAGCALLLSPAGSGLQVRSRLKVGPGSTAPGSSSGGSDFLRRRLTSGSTCDFIPALGGFGSGGAASGGDGSGAVAQEDRELHRALELSALEYEQRQAAAAAAGATADTPPVVALAPGVEEGEDAQLQRALALSLQEQAAAAAAERTPVVGCPLLQWEEASASGVAAPASAPQRPSPGANAGDRTPPGDDGDAQLQQGAALGPQPEIVEDDWLAEGAADVAAAEGAAAAEGVAAAAGAAAVPLLWLSGCRERAEGGERQVFCPCITKFNFTPAITAFKQLLLTRPLRTLEAMKKVPSSLTLFQDQPYSEPRTWDLHISWRRHLPEPLVFVRVLTNLAPIVIWCTAVATVVTCFNRLLQPKAGWPVFSAANWAVIFQLTSFVLGLLLVFRTNAAYDRWWEARKACGSMLNCVRNTQRMAISWMGPEDEAALQALTRWNAALAALAFAYLCARDAHYEHAEDLLSKEELAEAKRVRQPPMLALGVMSALLARTSLDPWERLAIEEQLTKMENMIGACERIASQPLPLAYTRHTSRFLVVWLSFLPFGLAEVYGWVTIPIVGVTAFLLAAVENVGIHIEQPMRVLPMARFAVGCKGAVLAIMAERQASWRLADAGVQAAQVGAAAAANAH